jgi:hypothetical protein
VAAVAAVLGGRRDDYFPDSFTYFLLIFNTAEAVWTACVLML